MKVADRGSQEYNKLFGGFLSRNLDIKKSIFPEEEDYRKFLQILFSKKLKVLENLLKDIKSSGIEQVIVKETGDACTEYNKLCKKKNIVAAFHLTC